MSILTVLNRHLTDLRKDAFRVVEGLVVYAIAIPQNFFSSTTVTSVASSATNVTLLAANTDRKFASFYNDSNKACFLKLGATASSTSFSIKIRPEGHYIIDVPVYTGIIDGIWTSANGSMRITEG